jgi:hypothetical protein
MTKPKHRRLFRVFEGEIEAVIENDRPGAGWIKFYPRGNEEVHVEMSRRLFENLRDRMCNELAKTTSQDVG